MDGHTVRVPVVSIVCIAVLVLALGGCQDNGAVSEPAPTAHSTAGTSPEAHITSPSATGGPPVTRGDDPRQLAVSLTEHARAGDWDAVRPYLIDALALFDDDVLHRTLGSLLVPAGEGTVVSDWDVEVNPSWTTVRLVDVPFGALLFHHQDDGSYLLDPAPHAFDRATEHATEATPDAVGQSPEGYQQELLATSDDDILPISRHLKRSLLGISRDGNSVTLSVQWMFVGGSTGTLPLDALQWTSNDEEGLVEIAWTTAVMTDDNLTFPAPEEQRGNTAAPYTVSLTLIGAPVNNDLHLLAERMTLHLPDGDNFTFAIDHTIPGDTDTQDAMATPTERPATPVPSAAEFEPGCDEEDIVPIMVSFLDAFNRRDQAALARLLPDDAHPRNLARPDPGGDQRVFYSFHMQGTVIFDLDELLAYFEERHAVGERLTLQDMTVGSIYRDWRWNLPEIADFGIQLIRVADDLEPHTVIGKGAINCVTGSIVMWSTLGDVDEGILDYSSTGSDHPLFTPVP